MNKIITKPFQLLCVCLLALSCIVTWSCKKTEDLQITCVVSLIKADAVVVHSTLSPEKQGIGVQITVLRNDSVVGRLNRTHNGNTDFNVPGLMPNTNYKVEMKIINDPTIKAEPCISSFTTLFSNTPLVTTSSISNVSSAGAVVTGEVTYEGIGPVTRRGVVYSTSANPGVGYPSTIVGSGLGTFTSTLSSLSHGTKYHVRAYAQNSAGWGYGADSTFTTLP